MEKDHVLETVSCGQSAAVCVIVPAHAASLPGTLCSSFVAKINFLCQGRFYHVRCSARGFNLVKVRCVFDFSLIML